MLLVKKFITLFMLCILLMQSGLASELNPNERSFGTTKHVLGLRFLASLLAWNRLISFAYDQGQDSIEVSKAPLPLLRSFGDQGVLSSSFFEPTDSDSRANWVQISGSFEDGLRTAVDQYYDVFEEIYSNISRLQGFKFAQNEMKLGGFYLSAGSDEFAPYNFIEYFNLEFKMEIQNEGMDKSPLVKWINDQHVAMFRSLCTGFRNKKDFTELESGQIIAFIDILEGLKKQLEIESASNEDLGWVAL